MVKQPAWAAPSSSSGLVPVPSSKREANEYGPSKAPLPSFIVPDPACSDPCHCASALRTGIAILLSVGTSGRQPTLTSDRPKPATSARRSVSASTPHRPSPSCSFSAVDLQHVAVDVGGVVGGEEREHRRHVLRPTHGTEWRDDAEKLPVGVRGQVVLGRDRGVDGPRRHAVHS